MDLGNDGSVSEEGGSIHGTGPKGRTSALAKVRAFFGRNGDPTHPSHLLFLIPFSVACLMHARPCKSRHKSRSFPPYDSLGAYSILPQSLPPTPIVYHDLHYFRPVDPASCFFSCPRFGSLTTRRKQEGTISLPLRPIHSSNRVSPRSPISFGFPFPFPPLPPLNGKSVA